MLSEKELDINLKRQPDIKLLNLLNLHKNKNCSFTWHFPKTVICPGFLPRVLFLWNCYFCEFYCYFSEFYCYFSEFYCYFSELVIFRNFILIFVNYLYACEKKLNAINFNYWMKSNIISLKKKLKPFFK